MVLIMLGSILNYLTRSTLAVAAPTLLKDLRIDEHQYSYILTAFQIAIMFQPICGYVLDVLGLRIGLAIFAGGWSLANMRRPSHLLVTHSTGHPPQTAPYQKGRRTHGGPSSLLGHGIRRRQQDNRVTPRAVM